MPYALGTLTPAPARVHPDAFRLIGHRPAWLKREYQGGLVSTEHYRTCSYCGCIHPWDMMDLLSAGKSTLMPTTKSGKLLLITPNPIAGKLVHHGSQPGHVFDRNSEPANLVSKLLLAAKPGLNPTIAERLTEHFDRPLLASAPDFIGQPFFIEHTTEPQWAEIEAAAKGA